MKFVNAKRGAIFRQRTQNREPIVFSARHLILRYFSRAFIGRDSPNCKSFHIPPNGELLRKRPVEIFVRTSERKDFG